MGKMKKVLIVQPHSDDALFNCGHFILSGDYEVEILTVESDPKRIKEDEDLYEFLGIPMSHLNVNFIDNSYYGFFKMYKGVDNKNAHSYLKEYFGSEKLDEIETALLKFVAKFRKKNPEAIILAPLGIAHPFHYFVHVILENEADLFYREFPHSYKKRSQEQFQASLGHYHIFLSEPDLEIHETKFELAKKFYRSQSGLLFFEQGYIKKQLAEEFYKKL